MKKAILGFLLLVILVIIALVVWLAWPNSNAGEQATKSSQTTQAPAKHKLAHIFVILEENKPFTSVIDASDAPYINSLAGKYALATNYSAITHPSLPNYLALTSGSTDGVTTDCDPSACSVNVKNIADELEAAHLSWREYAESMPSNCYAGNSGEYAVRHDPFVYYQDITSNASRCDEHVVPFTQLASDLKSTATTPDFAFITPNLCDDMHDCAVASGDNWLASEVPKILNSPAFTSQNSLLVITWDEGDAADNRIPTIFAGASVKPGYQSTANYNHYSLLKTIENNWNLAPLTSNDRAASPISDIFINR